MVSELKVLKRKENEHLHIQPRTNFWLLFWGFKSQNYYTINSKNICWELLTVCIVPLKEWKRKYIFLFSFIYFLSILSPANTVNLVQFHFSVFTPHQFQLPITIYFFNKALLLISFCKPRFDTCWVDFNWNHRQRGLMSTILRKTSEKINVRLRWFGNKLRFINVQAVLYLLWTTCQKARYISGLKVEYNLRCYIFNYEIISNDTMELFIKYKT